MKIRLNWFLLSCIFFFSSRAGATEPRAFIQTDLPVFLGVGLGMEKSGFQLSSSIGYLPDSYLQLTNSILVPLFEDEGYDQSVADLVRSTIKESLLWRSSLSLRPFEKSGFLLSTGYTLGMLGGDTSSLALVKAATGIPVPRQTFGSKVLRIHSSAFTHLLHVELAWTWIFKSRFWAKLGFGLSYMLHASSTVRTELANGLFDLHGDGSFENEIEKAIDDKLETYVHPPFLSFSLGWNW